MVQAKLNMVLSVLLLTIVLSLSSCAAQIEKAPVNDNVDAFIIVDDITAARADIENAGGKVVHIFPQDKVMIGELPYLFKSKYVKSVYYEGSKNKPKSGLVFYNAWIKNLEYSKLSVAEKMAMVGDDVPENPGNDVVEDPLVDLKDLSVSYMDHLNQKQMPFGDLTDMDTSLYMIGDVSVGIVTPESISGSEDWTYNELANVYSEIMNGLNWWSFNNPDAYLTFVYDHLEQMPVSSEPIELDAINRHYWGSEALYAGGYGDGESPFTDDAYDYVNSMRIEHDTDWGFVIFVADSSNDADGRFNDGKFAFAIMTANGGGPYLVMTYNNNGYGSGNMDAVVAHEMGHIFGAIDQYTGDPEYPCECADDVGYLNYENQNCDNNCELNESSIMRGDIPPFVNNDIDYYAKGQIGWQDNNTNNILDILEGGTMLKLDSQIENRTEMQFLSYIGENEITLFEAINPYYHSALIDGVNAIDYRYSWENGNYNWTNASVFTGIFDGNTMTNELFFQEGPLEWGTYLFEVESTNRFGNIFSQDSDEVMIVGCEGGNLDPKVKGYVTSYNGTYNSEEDTCISLEEYRYIIQYTCDDSEIVSTQTRCHYGCGDGRCLNKTFPRIKYRMMSQPIRD